MVFTIIKCFAVPANSTSGSLKKSCGVDKWEIIYRDNDEIILFGRSLTSS